MIYKTASNGITYYGTNAERLANFTTPYLEGLEYIESDTGDTYKIIFGAWVKIGTSTGGGASTFNALTDTPSSKTGQANKLVAVNSGESALEYVDIPTHNIITTHTASGLTTGHVLQATGATTFGFGAITESMISDLSHVDPNAIHVNTASEISAITEKVTPISTDLIIIEDSADSNNKKRVQIGNLPSGGGLVAHSIDGAYHTVVGSQYDVVGLTATNTLGILTPASDPAGANVVLLRTNTSGNINLQSGLTFNITSTISTSAGLLTFSPATYSYFTTNVGVFNNTPLVSLHVGSGNVNNSVDSQVLISRTVDDTISGNGHAYSDSSTINRAGGIAYNSYDARISFTGTNNYNHYVSFQSLPTYGSSGTIDKLYGLYSSLVVSAGTISEFFGSYADNASGSVGVISRQYGSYIAPLNYGVTNFAYYASNNKSVFNHTSAGGESLPLTATNVSDVANTAVGISLSTVADGATPTGKIISKRIGSGDYELSLHNFGSSGIFEAITIDSAGETSLVAGLNVATGISVNSTLAPISGGMIFNRAASDPFILMRSGDVSKGQFRANSSASGGVYLADASGTPELISQTTGVTIYTGALAFSTAATISTSAGLLTLTGTSGTLVSDYMAVGNTTPASNYVLRVANSTSNGFTQAVSASVDIDTDDYVYGMLFTPTLNMGATNYTKQIFAIEARPVTATGYSGNHTSSSVAFQANLYHYGSGNVTGIRLFQANDAYVPNSGTIGTQIGFFCGNMTKGTSNYAIYTNIGLIRLGDKVSIGTSTSPAYQLHVTETQTSTAATSHYMQYNGYTVAPTGTVIGNYNNGYFLTNVTATGTITGAVTALRANVTNTGGATLGFVAGILVDNISVGSAKYAIYTNAGLNSFGDSLQFRQASTISTTSGSITISPAAGSSVVNAVSTSGVGSFLFMNTATASTGNWSALQAYAKNSSGSDVFATGIYSRHYTITAGSESSEFVIYTNQSGSLGQRVIVRAGVQVGAPTGGDKGAGTINVSGNVYKNNSTYTNPDYALEYWATGKIEKYANNKGAEHYRRYSLHELEKYIRENHRLPGITDEPAGIFDMADIALEKTEELFTHIIEQRHEINSLKNELEEVKLKLEKITAKFL